MAYENNPINRADKDGAVRKDGSTYNEDIKMSMDARDTQFKDSDPMIEKEGFLGVDNLDKLRRRKLVVSN
jgi:hypothetical protein